MNVTTTCHPVKGDIQVRTITLGDTSPIIGFGPKYSETVTVYFKSWEDALHLAGLIQSLHTTTMMDQHEAKLATV